MTHLLVFGIHNNCSSLQIAAQSHFVLSVIQNEHSVIKNYTQAICSKLYVYKATYIKYIYMYACAHTHTRMYI